MNWSGERDMKRETSKPSLANGRQKQLLNRKIRRGQWRKRWKINDKINLSLLMVLRSKIKLKVIPCQIRGLLTSSRVKHGSQPRRFTSGIQHLSPLGVIHHPLPLGEIRQHCPRVRSGVESARFGSFLVGSGTFATDGHFCGPKSTEINFGWYFAA